MSAAPVPARPAATVVLVRDGVRGVEVYLQRRAAGIALGGVWVFPGGAVDAADRSPELDGHWLGPSPARWAARLGLGAGDARGAVAAACRELLEEAGVLVADPQPPAAGIAAARAALLAGRPLVEVLDGLGVRLRTDLLRYWAFWVTPEPEPRRHATRFFVAEFRRGMVIAPHEVEADRERWLPATVAAADRAMEMLPPTRHTLGTIGAFGSVAELLAAGEDRRVERILPRIEHEWVVLPWEERIPIPSQFASHPDAEPGGTP